MLVAIYHHTFAILAMEILEFLKFAFDYETQELLVGWMLESEAEGEMWLWFRQWGWCSPDRSSRFAEQMMSFWT